MNILNKLIKNWKTILLSLSIILIIYFGLMAYTSSGEFCAICHEMGTPYRTWAATKHGPANGRMSNCLPCHTSLKFGSITIAKIRGFGNLWNHFTGQYEMDDDIKAELPVYCNRTECHPNPEKVYIGNKIKVNHEFHINKGYACVMCHDRVGHGKDPSGYNMPEMKNYCFKCHNDETAIQSDCGYCHVYQEEMMGGRETISAHRNVEVGCVECHPKSSRSSEKICSNCHNEKDITKAMANQKEIQNRLNQTKDKIANLKDLIQKAKDRGLNIDRISDIYSDIEKNYKFLAADGSNGTHNMEYTTVLLRSAIIEINFANSLIKEALKK